MWNWHWIAMATIPIQHQSMIILNNTNCQKCLFKDIPIACNQQQRTEYIKHHCKIWRWVFSCKNLVKNKLKLNKKVAEAVKNKNRNSKHLPQPHVQQMLFHKITFCLTTAQQNHHFHLKNHLNLMSIQCCFTKNP